MACSSVSFVGPNSSQWFIHIQIMFVLRANASSPRAWLFFFTSRCVMRWRFSPSFFCILRTSRKTRMRHFSGHKFWTFWLWQTASKQPYPQIYYNGCFLQRHPPFSAVHGGLQDTKYVWYSSSYCMQHLYVTEFGAVWLNQLEPTFIVGRRQWHHFCRILYFVYGRGGWNYLIELVIAN